MIDAAVIGVGSMGANHARCYAALPGVRLAGLADSDPETARAAAGIAGSNVYLDYREMLRVERPQAVSVAVPAFLHEEVTMAALESGAHVIVEKPLALSVESGMRMLACARRQQRHLMVGFLERFNPIITRARQELLSTGRLGPIRQVVCRRIGPFPERIKDVGVVFDLALHDLDLLYFLTGRHPLSVYAQVGHQLQGLHEDNLVGVLAYEKGLTGLLEVNWLSPHKAREIWIYAEKGLLHANLLAHELTLYDVNGQAAGLAVPRGNPLELELQAFVQLIAGEAVAVPSGMDGLQSLFLALELLESGKSHQVRQVSNQPMS